MVAVQVDAGRETRLLERSTVSNEEGFAALRPEWDALVDRLELPSPFQSWDWNSVWRKHFGLRSRLHVVAFRREGRLVGIAPFHERRHGGWISSLVPIGWGNLLTEQLEFLFPRHERRLLMAELHRHLLETDHAWVGVSGLEPDDLASGFPGLGIVNEVRLPFEYRELPPTWDEMVRGLNRSMRGNVKYYPRLMQRSGCPHRFRIASTPADVSAALPIVYRLHSARAAAPDGVTHKNYLERDDHRAFLDEVAPMLAARGEMKVGMLEVQGEVVAVQIWMEKAKTIFLYYSGYLPEWSKYSVAMVTTSEILQDGISRGLNRVEFLRGTGHFKTRWDTTRRFQLEVTLARRATEVRVLLDSYRSARDLMRRFRRTF